MGGNSTGPLIDLDELDKLIIVAGAAVFLLIILFCLICSLNPACCLHKYCPAEYDASEKTPLQPDQGAVYDPATLSDQKGHGVKTHRGPLWHPMVPRESEMSDWSDVSMPEIIEMKRDQRGKNRKWPRTSDFSSCPSGTSSQVQHESRLTYGLAFNSVTSKLQVKVIQLGNFRGSEPDGAMAPYVKVCIYKVPKQFFTFKAKSSKELTRTHLESEVQTKIQRRTDNPVFNETFDITINSPDVSAYTIKFVVCDFDKYSRHVNIGEVICDLSKVGLASGNEILFNDLLLEPQEEDLGELHVALMYLPTAEKLSVTVLNAKGLKTMETPKRNTEVYTKISLMYEGRPLKKSKTASKGNEPCPVFNETFVFDVPKYQLDKVYFIIAVMEVDKDADDGRHLMGRLYIGVSFDLDVKAQWLEMVQNARKQVACWHRLQS